MKKFMLLHLGFEKPTPEIMAAWRAWFAAIADKQVDHGGFAGGREVTRGGVQDLPWNMESITGYHVIEADSLAAAVEVARSCPFIAGVRVYELRT